MEIKSTETGKTIFKTNLKKNFSNITFPPNADFKGMNLKEAIFLNSSFIDCDFSGADLTGAVFTNTNLVRCVFKNTNLEGAFFKNSNISSCCFRESKLSFARFDYAKAEMIFFENTNLDFTNFSGIFAPYSKFVCCEIKRSSFFEANLSHSSFIGCNLRTTNFSCAKLFESTIKESNMCGTNLNGTDLRNAKLYNVELNHIAHDNVTVGFSMCCPEEGSFIAFKKIDDFIIKLRIPEDAKRSSATTRKCRASKAEVLDIYSVFDKKEKRKSVFSNQYHPTTHTVGKTVYPDSFDENRWNECSHGIHFFITEEEAENY